MAAREQTCRQHPHGGRSLHPFLRYRQAVQRPGSGRQGHHCPADLLQSVWHGRNPRRVCHGAAGPAGLDRGHRGRAGRPVVRLDPAQADGAAGSGAGVPCARCGVGVREEPLDRAAVHDRSAAGAELRLPADEPGAVRRAGHRRSAVGAGLLRLRRDPEPQGPRPV